MRIKKRYQSVLLVLGFCLTSFALSDASADQYRLVKGKHVPVCELCKKNLESFNDTSMIRCGRQYDPKLADLKSVEWTKLDVLAHKDLVKKVNRFSYSGSQDAGKTFRGSTDAEFEESLNDDVRRQVLGLSIAETDIDNDGQPDLVLRYEAGTCPFKSAGQQLYVLTADRSALDVEKTNRLSGWGWGTSVGVFSSENTIYVDVWLDLDPQLTIYKYADGKVQELCVLKYRENPKASKSGR